MNTSRTLHLLATLEGPFGDRLLILSCDPFARAHVPPAGYELLPVRAACSALRVLAPDHELLSDLFSRVFERAPYESALAMLDALEEALGHGFMDEVDPPRWAKVVVARRSHSATRRSSMRATDAAFASPARRERAWIAIEMVRAQGGPAALTRCTVETPDGEVRSLSTNAHGQVSLEGIPAGPCRIVLPDLAEDTWRAPVESVPAGERPGTTHVVKQGESLVRIARQHGIADWKQVWEHGSNAPLRARRKSPHVLRPGDRVEIPATPQHQVTLPTNQLHRIVIEDAVVEIQVRLQDRARRALTELTYHLVATGPAHHISRPGAAPTDADGVLRERVPVGVEKLVLKFERPRLRFELRVDQLDPALDQDTGEPIETGVDARLHALGFSHGALRERVEAFQRTRLSREDATGALDDVTCRALENEYGA